MTAILPTARALYAIVALGGGVLMALEILSLRVLSPAFGSSVYVWGSVISVFLGAMSLGYVWGGRAADRTPELPRLGGFLLLSALCQAALLFGGLPLVQTIADRLAGRTWGPLVATTVLFGPATLLLAMVSPFVVRIAATDLARLGGLAGRLYAVSTIGSMAGALAATFLLVPFLGLGAILGLLMAGTIGCALLTTGRELRERPLHVAAALALLVLLAAGVAERSAERDLRTRRMTRYQTLEVRDEGEERILRSNGQVQSAVVRATGETALAYPRVAVAAMLFAENDDAIEDVLVIGLGAGSVARHWWTERPATRFEHVEIDPVVVELAREEFGFAPAGASPIHVEDGRAFLRRGERRWDLIYADTYLGLSIPFHLTTREFFRLVRQRLDDGGVFATNLAADPRHPFVAAVVATIGDVFPQVYAFRIPDAGGTLVVATEQADRLRRGDLEARARRLDDRYGYEPGFGEIVEHLLPPEAARPDVEPLTDDFAPVDRLLHLDR